MSNNTDDKSIEEVVIFLKTIIQINKTFKKSNGIVDCNNILKLFEYEEAQYKDSGFESEPIPECNIICMVPAIPLNKIIFEINDLDLILENSLISICKFIKQTKLDSIKNKSKIENILDFTIQFVEYLAEIISNVPFREIIQTFLDSMLNNSIADDEHISTFNFIMELFQRFGAVPQLEECILDIILNYLKTFIESLKIEGADPSFSVHYESDFSRANTLLLTLMIIQKTTKISCSPQYDEDICNILQAFVKLDDFFSLGFLSYKCLLTK